MDKSCNTQLLQNCNCLCYATPSIPTLTQQSMPPPWQATWSTQRPSVHYPERRWGKGTQWACRDQCWQTSHQQQMGAVDMSQAAASTWSLCLHWTCGVCWGWSVTISCLLSPWHKCRNRNTAVWVERKNLLTESRVHTPYSCTFFLIKILTILPNTHVYPPICFINNGTTLETYFMCLLWLWM